MPDAGYRAGIDEVLYGSDRRAAPLQSPAPGSRRVVGPPR